ncbi:MAG: hypothetical protein NT062_16975 [Proteobacteria bacterium]|nr:hypothetical protein [Pseudomonadota bacterium]
MATISDSAAIHLSRRAQAGTSALQGLSCYDPATDRARAQLTLVPIRELVRPELDAQLLAILDGARLLGETVHAQFLRKEHQLASVFASLAVVDALALHKRLVTPKAGDALALTFSRLVVDRRHRLLGFLADAPRRAARGR